MDRRTMMKGAAATAAVAAGGPVLAQERYPATLDALWQPMKKALLAANEFGSECVRLGCHMNSPVFLGRTDWLNPTDPISRSCGYAFVEIDPPWPSSGPLEAVFAQLATPCGSGLVVARRIDRPTGTTHDDFQDALFNASVMKFAKELAGRLLAEHKAESLAA